MTMLMYIAAGFGTLVAVLIAIHLFCLGIRAIMLPWMIIGAFLLTIWGESPRVEDERLFGTCPFLRWIGKRPAKVRR